MASNHTGGLRTKMDPTNRAKQFMPFDALKGFREALAEKERNIVPKRELSEEQKIQLNLKICQIQRKDIVTVEFFQNGEYFKVTGMVSKIDKSGRILIIVNQKISFDDIFDLKSDIFEEYMKIL